MRPDTLSDGSIVLWNSLLVYDGVPPLSLVLLGKQEQMVGLIPFRLCICCAEYIGNICIAEMRQP